MSNKSDTQKEQGTNNSTDTDLVLKKRAAVRRRLAMALMAVGGTLIAAAIWYGINYRAK